MVKAQILTYARIKPPQGQEVSSLWQRTQSHELLATRKQIGGSNSEKWQVRANLQLESERVSANDQEQEKFPFTQVFDQNSSQEDIFSRVARPVVLSCLEGYNGTIFAYGQTGSGKTYTMNGGESWRTRGIIPRVLSLLYDEYEKRKDCQFRTYVSYLEIYKENGYDLLDKRHVDVPFKDWNKISLFQDDEGFLHMQNLSIHECESEEQALNRLMLGDIIRQVSATPMNPTSSRSHCIFTIALACREKKTNVSRISKLHLVDLAGSERVYKTNSLDSFTAEEGRYINLSLTYLEQVIVALYQRAKGQRTHIPYRNSMMTSILRDSLGGNC